MKTQLLSRNSAAKCVIASMATVSCFTLLTACASADGQAQAVFVTKALHNLSTITSISAEYTISNTSSPGALLRYRYLRSDDGEYFEDRTQPEPQMASIDSHNMYSWKKINGVVFADVMELAQGKADFELKHSPEHLLGTRIFDAIGMCLIDVLKDRRIVVDAKAYSITLSGFAPQRPGGAFTVEVHFDPDHLFLPKVIQTTLTDAPTEGARYLQRWEILEYFEVKDQATGNSRWFPHKAVLTQGIPNSITMEVLDAAVNIKIPAQTFTPDLPVGSQVYDKTKTGAGGSYVVGANGPELDTRINVMTQQSAVRSSNVTLVVLNVALILVLIGLLAWRRSRNNGRKERGNKGREQRGRESFLSHTDKPSEQPPILAPPSP